MSQPQSPYFVTTTPPPQLVADFNLARSYASGESRCAWGLAEVAARIVGTYQPGVTRELAQYIGASVDKVENYAAAWRLYQHMFNAPYNDFRGVSELRDMLTISHWICAARIAEKYNADLYRVYSWLEDCIESESVRLSVRELAQIAEADMQTEKRPVDWRRFYLPRLRKVVLQMLTFPDLPVMLRAVLEQAAQWSE